jgi:hypothetical protein
VVVYDRADWILPEPAGVHAQMLRGGALDGMGRPTDFSKCVFVFTAGPVLSGRLEAADQPVEDVLADALTADVAGLIRRVVSFGELADADVKAIVQAALKNTPAPTPEVAEAVQRFREAKELEDLTHKALAQGGNGYAAEAAVEQELGRVLWDRFGDILDNKS